MMRFLALSCLERVAPQGRVWRGPAQIKTGYVERDYLPFSFNIACSYFLGVPSTSATCGRHLLQQEKAGEG